jgi:hypothetical protein
VTVVRAAVGEVYRTGSGPTTPAERSGPAAVGHLP